ncbi:hypothetical protein Acsp03_66490 [Actinomadura sp. NBRC 104412]|uniref:hypothetical protein n=1 Tax=Actinomadura sp. NBRC 104412 TaxID=3032203 RepID=UPI0024A222D2|nr:hypothetical protein [Actinomadura sp. NBRC 104412]GLZ09183.1 hypothetical protein Acsp03_66490 [Actinomadura sp. NBRC 104412]
MRKIETPQEIAQKRTVTADALLSGSVDLRMYPHRHVAVVSHGNAAMSLTGVIAAVEYLCQWGWELVSLTNVGNNITMMCAVMRRTG